MTKLDKDQVIAKFTEAYTATNGNAPTIEAKGGWYSVDGGKNMRLAQLNDMADELSAGGASTSEDVPAPKAEAKKAAPKKKATTKKAAKKPASFSVKAFYAEQLAPGSTAPR